MKVSREAAPGETPLDVLERRLGYRFTDVQLLRRALNHRSMGADNWERLEFLGDAVLGLVVSRALFDAKPGASEQQLTLMRANLVQKAALAGVARDIGLSAFITLGTAERNAGVAENSAIRADALEAVLGAVACDGGVAAATAVVERLFGSRLAGSDAVTEKDPKSRLQEIMQAKRLALPDYTVVETSGEEHARIYHVECVAGGLDVRAGASASSVRDAEKRAAAAVLALIASAEPSPAAAPVAPKGGSDDD